MIYELALFDYEDIWIFSGSAQTDYKHPINLLCVCRQTQAETALLPYALNLFWVFDPVPLQFLRRRTPAQIGAMTKVREFYLAGGQKSAAEWMKTPLKAL